MIANYPTARVVAPRPRPHAFKKSHQALPALNCRSWQTAARTRTCRGWHVSTQRTFPCPHSSPPPRAAPLFFACHDDRCHQPVREPRKQTVVAGNPGGRCGRGVQAGGQEGRRAGGSRDYWTCARTMLAAGMLDQRAGVSKPP